MPWEDMEEFLERKGKKVMISWSFAESGLVEETNFTLFWSCRGDHYERESVYLSLLRESREEKKSKNFTWDMNSLSLSVLSACERSEPVIF